MTAKKQKYQWVKVGDSVMEADQYFDPADKKWKPTGAIGATVNHRRSYRRPVPYPPHVHYPHGLDSR